MWMAVSLLGPSAWELKLKRSERGKGQPRCFLVSVTASGNEASWRGAGISGSSEIGGFGPPRPVESQHMIAFFLQVPPPPRAFLSST